MRPRKDHAARSRRSTTLAASASAAIPLLCFLAIPLMSCVKSPSAPSAAPPSTPASVSAGSTSAYDPAAAHDIGSAPAGPDERLYTEKPELLAYVQSVGKK